jgi:hypothetical protein
MDALERTFGMQDAEIVRGEDSPFRKGDTVVFNVPRYGILEGEIIDCDGRDCHNQDGRRDVGEYCFVVKALEHDLTFILPESRFL